MPDNLGTGLALSMQEIERVHPDTLYRGFGSADWGNREKFGDEILKDLIESFPAISLGNNSASVDRSLQQSGKELTSLEIVRLPDELGCQQSHVNVLDVGTGRAEFFHGLRIVRRG